MTMSEGTRLHVLEAVNRLVDRAPRHSDLAYHRLQVFAARHWRAQGRPVPGEFEREEQFAAVAGAAAPALLEQVRAAYDGPLLLLKGPEVAARYPDPTLRPFSDLDLLVTDAAAAQAALLEAGFTVVEGEHEKPELHHRAPLLAPGLPLVLELHDRPKWPRGKVAPARDELFAAAVPAQAAPDLLTLPPASHAVLLAAHAWAHRPLRRVLDVVDVALMLGDDSREAAADVARRWDVEGIWAATVAAADALFRGDRRPWPLLVWARNLVSVRERTVLASHFERWTAVFCELPPRVCTGDRRGPAAG